MTLLGTLQQRTRAAHEHLDATLDFRRPGSVTRDRYACLLLATRNVVAHLEPALARWIAPKMTTPTRVACLDADLAALGEDGDCDAAPMRMPESLAEAYGCAYVLEGSALGGLVLSSMVQRDLGPDAPVAYLTLRGAATGSAWRAFMQQLEAFGARSGEDEHRAAARMAETTFDGYAASFRRAGIASGAA